MPDGLLRGVPELEAQFAALESSANVSYVLSPELRVVRWNDAWTRFAFANGGAAFVTRWQPHTSLLEVIPAVLQPFYISAYDRAVATQEPWEHDYECSSPETFRKYRMISYPFGRAFVVTHSLLVEHPHPDRDVAPRAASYEVNGIVTMCSHCRRVKPADITDDRWDWLPRFVSNMPSNVEHALCGPCMRYHYAYAS